MAIISRISAPIRYITVYRCDACGREQNGATASVQLDSLSAIQAFLDNPPQRSHDMPVGWASHYGSPRDVFTCGCKKHGVSA